MNIKKFEEFVNEEYYDDRHKDILYSNEYEFVQALVHKAIKPEYYESEYENAISLYGKQKIQNIIGSITGGISISNYVNYKDYYNSSKNLNYDPRK